MNAINNEAIVWAFNQNTMSINALAGRLDVNNDTVEGILRGTIDLADLRLSTLITLGDLLAVPLHAMFREPEPLPPDAAKPSPADDAERLVACLYDRGENRTLIADLAAALGWTPDRLNAAATDADTRLHVAGLRIYRTSGFIRISPLRDHTQARRNLAERETGERGMAAHHYKAAHQLLTGTEAKANESSWNRRLVMGTLANHGIVTEKLKRALTPEALEGIL